MTTYSVILKKVRPADGQRRYLVRSSAGCDYRVTLSANGGVVEFLQDVPAHYRRTGRTGRGVVRRVAEHQRTVWSAPRWVPVLAAIASHEETSNG